MFLWGQRWLGHMESFINLISRKDYHPLLFILPEIQSELGIVLFESF